jgi:phage shock protein A
VHQLREENTRKWRVEERNDWKSLVDSVQRDRAELQEMNEALNERVEELETELEQLRAEREQSSSSSSSSSSEHIERDESRLLSVDVQAAGTAVDDHRGLTIPTTPNRLQRELQETRRRLESAESERAREKAETQRLREELGARRERERWQQNSGLILRLVRMTRLWQRGPPALPSHRPVNV